MSRRLSLLPALLLAACSPSEPPQTSGAGGDCCASKAAAAKKDACCEPAKAPAAKMTVSRDWLKPGSSRSFSVEYTAKVPAPPPGTKSLRLWIPVPSSDSVQEIRALSFSKEPRLGVEPKYGGRIASWDFPNPSGPVEVTMRFDCTRLEVVTDLARLADEGRDEPGSFEVFRKADALVLVDDEIRKLAAEVVKGKTGTVEKARAIYDHVVGRMVYDKNHAGWGRGSTEHACKVGKGNCTDFHALFNSLCRAEGIASGFEIGLYLPYAKGSAEAPGGYHCWALFRVPGKTWVPVDCSEAMRLPERRAFFFGGSTPNRVTLSTGRDLVLEPAQAGPPLNFFLNPYAEGDGRPVPSEKTWSFKDLEG